ncbi:polysaccharide pyruvyl transferase CsaB [Caldibacillus lycopersici]|uniref:Polysaccharide pyruvyl transferase CsaB n=1 Tax=Perspicuibacillus lycopersici TaxID=1325689 RepID=A0AAE3LM73_9BACI|nr:polysaccharide pyruvyl transferase CsaB [Perspicuibacillus lycopersici]MCU9613255.1 polysaccharide pyruvyl transferase CsaB [Perspicuibacillus lycopersici]
MNVVLCGYYGFDNVGDEAILFSIVRALKNLHANITITVLSNNPEKTKETYGVEAVNRWRFKEVCAAIKASNGLICGGGSLLQDETGWKSVPYYSGVMRLAIWMKKPVFVYAQGMGPINRRFNKWVVSHVLNKVNEITVRDEASKLLLQNIGIKRSISIVPDPVLSLEGIPFQSEWLTTQKIERPFITVSVRNWPTPIEYKKKIAEALDELAYKGYTVVFVPMHSIHDQEASQETAQLMNENSRIAPCNLEIGEKISIIGESELLIGMRLHSLIFAAISHTPFITISYDPKMDAFAALVEQPVVGHVESDDWDGNTLFDLAIGALKNEDALSSYLKEKVEKFKAEAMETPKMVLEILEMESDGEVGS